VSAAIPATNVFQAVAESQAAQAVVQGLVADVAGQAGDAAVQAGADLGDAKIAVRIGVFDAQAFGITDGLQALAGAVFVGRAQGGQAGNGLLAAGDVAADVVAQAVGDFQAACRGAAAFHQAA
jgi:hypothetical protein